MMPTVTAGITTRALADDAKIVDYLLVQTAKGLTFDKASNTLIPVGPITLFFADRPERVADNMRTSAFILSGARARTALRRIRPTRIFPLSKAMQCAKSS
jgi:hypothetical protein